MFRNDLCFPSYKPWISAQKSMSSAGIAILRYNWKTSKYTTAHGPLFLPHTHPRMIYIFILFLSYAHTLAHAHTHMHARTHTNTNTLGFSLSHVNTYMHHITHRHACTNVNMRTLLMAGLECCQDCRSHSDKTATDSGEWFYRLF